MSVLEDFLSAIFAAIVCACILGGALDMTGLPGSANILCEWTISPIENTRPKESPMKLALDSETMEPESILTRSPGDMAPPPLPFPRPGFTGSPSSPGSSPRVLKLNFPISGSELDPQSQSVATASPRSSRSVSPLRSTSPCREPLKTEEPTQFLTALAAQERRVLELREELKKAENDLVRLKYEWTTHEAARKRDEVTFQPLQLRPMISPTKDAFADGNAIDSPGSSPNVRHLTNGGRAKSSQRRFEGGKHTRALSLLTPITAADDMLRKGASNVSDGTQSGLSHLHRSRNSIATVPHHANSPHHPEELVSGGKQLVGDLRDGLWTFIEDLRQVTVGDEATSPKRRKPVPKFERKEAAAPVKDSVTEPCLRSDVHHQGDPKKGSREPLQLASGNHLKTVKDVKASLAVGSDHQSERPVLELDPDLPQEAAKDTSRNIASDSSNKDTSREVADKIAWPSLGSFSPSRLSKTASSLMQEWERSLMEPAEARPSQPI